MKELLEAIAKALVDNPDHVQVRAIEGEQLTVLDRCLLCGSPSPSRLIVLSPEQRSEIARKAVLARWAKHKKDQQKPQ